LSTIEFAVVVGRHATIYALASSSVGLEVGESMVGGMRQSSRVGKVKLARRVRRAFSMCSMDDMRIA